LLAVAATGRAVDVVGVQSEAAPSATASWLAGRVVELPCTTFAGGLATTRPGTVALHVALALLGRMAVVTEDDLDRAMATMLASHGIQLEGAAAASLAALSRYGDRIAGDTIGLLITGNWASSAEVERATAIAAADR
jgi:threonine dehydratase